MGTFGKNSLPKFLIKRFGNKVLDEDEYASTGMRDINMLPNLEKDNADKTDLPDNLSNITRNTMTKTKRVVETFEQFNQHKVNEDDMIIQEPEEINEPCEDCDQSDTLSENAKSAIKRMVNEVLIKEAHLHESSADPNQTYESFLREATHYMAECLIRAAQNLKV